ncbi:MAG: RcnB family protein [Parvibaculum sp.]
MALTMSLLASTASFAADARRDNQGQRDDQRQDDTGRSDRTDRHDNRNQDNPRREDQNARNDNRNDNRHDNSGWGRGQRVPDQYRNNKNYIVNDWQRRNLRQPPRGYQWVRNDDNQFFLTLIATGIIAEIFLQNSSRPQYQWTRGQRLDGYDMDNRHVVTNWRRAHLHRPWRGHHWVHIDNRFMMIRDRNGEIVEIIVARNY